MSAPAPACDAWAGLIPVESGTGCVLRVQVGVADGWQQALLFLVVIVMVSLGALVVGQFRRGGG